MVRGLSVGEGHREVVGAGSLFATELPDRPGPAAAGDVVGIADKVVVRALKQRVRRDLRLLGALRQPLRRAAIQSATIFHPLRSVHLNTVIDKVIVRKLVVDY